MILSRCLNNLNLKIIEIQMKKLSRVINNIPKTIVFDFICCCWESPLRL
jgi:hypothetical protein